MIVAVCPQAEATLARLWVFLSPPELVELLTGLEAKLAEVQAAKSKLIVASACLTTAFTSRYALFACFKLVQLLSSFIIQAILATFTLAPSVAQVSIPS